MIKRVLPSITSQFFYRRTRGELWQLLVASLLGFIVLSATILPPISQVEGSPRTTYIPDFYVLTNEGVIKVSSIGTKETIIAAYGESRSIEILNNELYVSNETHGGDILVHDLDGNYLRTIPTPSQVTQYLEFVTLPDGRIALLDNINDKIYFIDSSGNLLTTTNILDSPDSYYQNLDGVVVGNRLIFSEDGNNHILQIDLDTYEKSIFKDLSSLPHWLGAITYAEGQYYICGPRTVYSFVDGGNVTKIAEVPEGNITGIVVVDNYAYVSVNFGGKIYKIDLSNGTNTIFTSGLNYPKDLEAGAASMGTISGKVTDSTTGEAIHGATVSANGYSTSTDSNGHYSLSVSPGTYTVTASASGYQSQTKTNITLTAGETTQVDFALTPESPAPKFLTLPFIDFDIKIQQGWRYNAPLGPPDDPYRHEGIDYVKGDWEMFDVVATADGKAMWSEDGTYGRFVLIQHSEKDPQDRHYYTLYAHLDSVTLEDESYCNYDERSTWNDDQWNDINCIFDEVKRGEVIGRAGSTGVQDPDWIHLHFEVQRGGYAQNKIDPYDIEKTREFYPGGNQYTSCGPNYLWTTDPPSTPTTFSTSAKKWRMFSIPFRLNDPSPSSVLQDLGQQDDNLWKVYRWNTNTGSYSKYPDISDFTPGRAFWLITKEPESIDVGEGISVDSSSDYPIPLSYSASLNQGWNQIGDPFAFSINLTDVKVKKDSEIVSIQQAQENSWVRNRIWWYNGSEYDFTKNILEPWEGYWVKALTEGCELLIPSFETQESSLQTLASSEENYLQIIAKLDDLKDSYNFIGLLSSAKDGYDAEDVEEAPSISPYISLFFPHPEWGKDKGDYTQDIRSKISQTGPRQVWNFQVKTDQINQEIILEWENTLAFPDSLQLYLTDPSENVLVNMRRKSSYTFISSSGLESFKIIATPEVLPLAEDLDLNEVYGYPNPAHGKGIRFHFHLVSSAKVTIKIYSISGELVRTLVKDKDYVPGAYEELWKEDNDRGQKLARGIYIFTIRATNPKKDISKSGKIVLL